MPETIIIKTYSVKYRHKDIMLLSQDILGGKLSQISVLHQKDV